MELKDLPKSENDTNTAGGDDAIAESRDELVLERDSHQGEDVRKKGDGDASDRSATNSIGSEKSGATSSIFHEDDKTGQVLCSDHDRSYGEGKHPVSIKVDDTSTGPYNSSPDLTSRAAISPRRFPSQKVAESPHRSKARGSSPVAARPSAIRSRVGNGVRHILSLGLNAQIIPDSSLSPTAPRRISPIRLRSPLSWGRQRSGRTSKGPAGKVVPTLSVDDGPVTKNMSTGSDNIGGGEGCGGPSAGRTSTLRDDQDVGTKGETRESEHRHTRRRDSEDKTKVAQSAQGHYIPENGGDNGNGNTRPTVGNGSRNRGEIVSDTGDDSQVNIARDGGSAIFGDIVVGAEVSAPSSKEASEGLNRIPRRVLARDLTLVDCDSWPAELDNEADPQDWALEESEGEVLAAAKRMGSVLVRVVTWNLHAKPTPAVEQLRKSLINPGKFHIYSIGTEECQNSIAKSVIAHSKKEWESVLKKTLGANYEMLCGHGLQATHNAVFAHRGILPLLRDVRSLAVATGLSLGAPGTTLGNKGGIGISFNVGATSCVFVNSHLAAHQNNARERNEHFLQISRGLARGLASSGTQGTRDASPPNHRQPTADGWTAKSRPSLAPVPPPISANDTGGHDVRKISIGISTPLAMEISAFSDERHQICPEEPSSPVPRGARDGPPVRHTTTEEESTSQVVTPPNVAEHDVKSVSTAARPEAGSSHSFVEDSHITSSGASPMSPGRGAVTPTHALASPSSSHRGKGGHRAWQRGRGGVAGAYATKRSQDTMGVRPLPESFDRVVWAGDLNYRVNVPRSVADVLLAKSMHAVLLKNDQLSIERSRNDDNGGSFSPFTGYHEGPLNFRPTYKFDSGTDTYDSSPKQRVPAWTDRVLFAGGSVRADNCRGKERGAGLKAGGMHLRAYRSVPELKTSDHRPVIASFVLDFDHLGVEDGRGHGEEDRAAVINQTSSEVCTIM